MAICVGGRVIRMSWVYDKLVQSSDIPGQFAYLYYKSEKRKFAENLKTSGTPDEDIPKRLKGYQNNVVRDETALASFKAGGDAALKNFLATAEEATLASAKENFARQNRELGEKIHELNELAGQPRGKLQRFISWLLIGVRAWLVTALIGIILFLLALMLVSDGTQENVFDEALDGVIRYIECQKSNAPPECEE